MEEKKLSKLINLMLTKYDGFPNSSNKCLNIREFYRDNVGRLDLQEFTKPNEELYNYIELGFFKKEKILLENLNGIIEIAEKLANYVDNWEIYEKISSANKVGRNSKDVQDIMIEFCKDLGFESEKKRLFKHYNLRPDYYKKIDDGGIILEVERGRTFTNNMDLYDLWKCHICEEANHLFLFVPKNISHTKNIYEATFKRFSSFFREEKDNINIDSIFLFGY